MREETRNIYKFDELSNDVQEKIISDVKDDSSWMQMEWQFEFEYLCDYISELDFKYQLDAEYQDLWGFGIEYKAIDRLDTHYGLCTISLDVEEDIVAKQLASGKLKILLDSGAYEYSNGSIYDRQGTPILFKHAEDLETKVDLFISDYKTEVEHKFLACARASEESIQDSERIAEALIANDYEYTEKGEQVL